MTAGVYEIVNTINGKRYVGSAMDLYNRKAVHWCDLKRGRHHSSHLQHAWKKYGESAFVFKTLLVCAPRNCVFYEQRAIDRLFPEYNMRPKAESNLGMVWPLEMRNKIAATLRGQRIPLEVRAKISAALRGKIVSKETGAKISVAKMGKPISREQHAKLLLANKGRALTAEHRAKLSAAHKGHAVSDEVRARIAKNRTGKRVGIPLTAVHRVKLSVTSKKWANLPENRKANSIRVTLWWANRNKGEKREETKCRNA